MNEFMKRAGYVLLGVLLTIIVILLINKMKDDKTDVATDIYNTEGPIIEMVEESEPTLDFNQEAEEKLAALSQEEQSQTAGNVDSISANSIEAAKLKWKLDYPTNNAEKTLEENQSIRSSYEETLATNAFDKKVIENSTVDFSDIKITILGDSITAAANLDEDEQSKYNISTSLKNILGAKEVYNLAVGGSAISRAADSYAMVDRWSDIPKDTDIIIVFGGTNDTLVENKWEYGELEYEKRMTKGTFCGDLDEMLGGMKYTYREHNTDSYIKFLIVNPPATVLADAAYNRDPGNMVHQSAFAEAINEIAPAYGFEVIDMYNNNLFDSHDANVNANLIPDGVHGNPACYQMIAEHLASQIIQRINQ